MKGRGKKRKCGADNEEEKKKNKSRKKAEEKAGEESRRENENTEGETKKWKERWVKCPNCGTANDKTEKHARQERKPHWKRWNCNKCHKQTWASAWTCTCGIRLTECEMHKEDPIEHKTIAHRWLKKEEIGEEGRPGKEKVSRTKKEVKRNE